MAGRNQPEDSSRPLIRGPFSEPRSQRWASRQYRASLDEGLSLAAELRLAEGQVSQRSLPNNLGWSFPRESQSPSSKKGDAKKKGKHFEQVKLPAKASPDSPPSGQFTRKRHHTPATIPRTYLPPGMPSAEHQAMESLRQHLSFEDEEGTSRRTTRMSQTPSIGTANNERTLSTQSKAAASVTLPVLEMNETDTRPVTSDAGRSSINTPLIISRLNQVRDFLKQATTMFVTLQSSGVNEQQSSELSEQTVKIARLIRQLKQQERAYVELLQRSVAVEHDSTLENTPSMSLQSLTEEEKSESASIRDEELQGLRQQHALLKKMLAQQQQLKELQTRQAALLTLQHDAETRLAEAEEEGRHISVELSAEGVEGYDPGRSRGETETSQASVLNAAEGQRPSSSAIGGSQFTPEEQELLNLLRMHKEKVDLFQPRSSCFKLGQVVADTKHGAQWRAADSGDEKERDERENKQRVKKRNHPGTTFRPSVDPGPSSEVTDNEEAALVLANATQERLELENKLMVLEAKKEQMDTLLQELQSLREAQLKKESFQAAGGVSSSVNESKQEEDEPLATTSQKLDDERILEALEVHEKLQKLQEVRDRLKQLRDLIGHYQPNSGDPNRPEYATQAPSRGAYVSTASVESSIEPTEPEGAVGGAGTAAVASTADQDFNSIEWMLSSGIEDPDLLDKIRQLQEARERVAHLFKQTNENAQQVSTSRVNNEAGKRASIQTQATEEESDAETQTETDAESAVSAGSSSVNALAWQDDPEFQAKVRKLNSAKQKLKQLQELVKKIQQFPESTPTLPAELAELSFDEDDYDEEGENEDDDEEDDDEDDEEQDGEHESESNRSETSGDNDLHGTRHDGDDDDDGGGTTGTEDDDGQAVGVDAAISRNRMLDLEGSDQEAVYQRYLEKQTTELKQLQQERKRLLEVQEDLARITQSTDVHKTVATQTGKTTTKKPEAVKVAPRSATFTMDRTSGAKNLASQEPVQRERSTQTPFYGSNLRAARSVESSESPRARPSALVWSELRRQRELHEEKLKKRKQKFLEKRKKAGLDDVSEGGTYSVRSGRSGDMDEGFGVSMMSADITTATWGGSTQPSSTQNDSAVSADESDEENQGVEIQVEVEDDYPDGIVQAEEEEEERLEPEAFSASPDAVFRSRERVPRLSALRESIDSTSQPTSSKKRKLDATGGARKRDRIRGLTFEDWPTKWYFDRNSRGRIRQENFTPAEQLIKEREHEQFNAERQAWEQHCERLHQEVSNLTTLCNGLLRDQQLLVSTIIGRNTGNSPVSNVGRPNIPAHVTGLGGNPFEQYQQRQQEAYQGLQSFFDQQRYLQQQYQMLQSLNQCYLQLQQQHQDMAFLQQQFQQLFSHNMSFPLGNSSTTSPQRAQSVTPIAPPSLYPSFCSLPNQSSISQSFAFQPPFSAPLFSQSPFTSSYQPPLSAPLVRGAWAPPFGQASGPEQSPRVSANVAHISQAADSSRQASFYTAGTLNPDTGIPSAGATAYQGHPVEPAPPPSTSGYVNPLVVREVGTSKSGTTATSNTDGTYDPASYSETANTGVRTTETGHTTDVIGRTFPTPLRASAAASLAQKDKSVQNPSGFGLGKKLAAESIETSSRASSVPGDGHDVGKGCSSWQEADRASEAGSEFSLFEALRDSIYSEVATLISLNESRPHFLLELFRELQLLTSDYLRQRALYALQDLVTRFLTEDSLGTEGAAVQHQARFQEWLGSNSELTPSETVETFEDDESDVRGAAVPAETITEGIYDYVENVESGSTLSTPTSSHTEEVPFASEGLGDTVIHLDKALSRMREYERLRTEGKLGELVTSPSNAKDDVTTSSAGDVGSESSISDVQYPRIDTQALDHLIKSIMSEVIPYLNEHMEDTCSLELLGYVRNLVLARIQVNEQQEFGRFFHKQLATILQDSLARFTDKKMKDCGEDMLVDMSEILFNELAFFRLMQDLDHGTRGASARPQLRQGYASSTDTGTGQEGDREDGDDSEEKEEQHPEDSAVEEEGERGAVATSAAGGGVVAPEREEAEGEERDDNEEDSSQESSEESGAEDEGVADDEGQDEEGNEEDALPISKEEQEAEEEELGKARDDVMASQFEDKPPSLPGNSTLDSPQCVQLELSVSESKPFSSTGSGEEDGEESFDDTETRQLQEYVGGTAAAANRGQVTVRGGHSDSDDDDNDDDDGAPQDEQHQALQAAAAAAAGTVASAYFQNGQVVNGHDDGDVTLDDLPTKLTGLTEADLQARISQEQSRTEGSSAVVAHIDGFQELAGDPDSVPEPESSERPVNGLDGDLDK